MHGEPVRRRMSTPTRRTKHRTGSNKYFDRAKPASLLQHEMLADVRVSGLASRVSPVQTALRNYTRDGGRSFEFGDQKPISSYRKLLPVNSRGGEGSAENAGAFSAGPVKRAEPRSSALGRARTKLNRYRQSSRESRGGYLLWSE